MLILQLVSHRNFQKDEFFLQFLFSANKKFVLKVTVRAQVIKKYIFLSGAKLNDPLLIDYVPNVFKFTKIPAKRTQESLRRYERAQKRQRRPNVTSSKTFAAPNICKDSRMELGRHNDKGTRIIRLFSLFYN